MQHSDVLNELAKAFVAAQAELKNPYASSTADTGSYRYKYAPLDDILNDVRAVLGRHGLALLQETETGQAAVGVRTVILHESGQWIEFGPLLLPAGNTAQSAGSATTYARRYALCAALGIAADEDDDAASPEPFGSPPSGSDQQATSAVRPGDAEGGAGATSPPYTGPADPSGRGPSSPSPEREPAVLGGTAAPTSSGGSRPSDTSEVGGSTTAEGHGEGPEADSGTPASDNTRRDKMWSQLVEFSGNKKKAVNAVNRVCKASWEFDKAYLIPEEDIELTLRAVLKEAG